MTELPPPERRPEPLGFDPAKNRIAEREPARESHLERPSTGTLQPTRNLQTDLIGRTVSDRYLVKGVLGEGGMGTVYEAEHLGLGRAVAIKVLNPSQAKKRVAVKRFQQEARAAGAIGHPNICEVYDLGLLDDGSPYLVMEKLNGTTLADRISREGGLPFDEIADVMIQVLSGLIAAHDKGIVHRDIKPENIFLARRVGCPPVVKILDFGVSKMMPQFQGGDEQLDLTRTGMVMGTPYYMSPEQARGERNLDGRVDVYACGVMMYEAIVGKRPFLAPNYNALLLSIINTTPRPLREVRPATPPGFDAIVQRSMAKARDDRYPSANAVLRDVQALPVAGSGSANRVPAAPTAEERMRAPVLGGRSPNRDRDRDEATRDTRGGGRPRAPEGTAGAAATLRSRMADAPPPQSRDNATRLDIKVKDVRDAARRDTRDMREPNREPNREDSGSVEIPIHITGSDLLPVQVGPGGGEFVDEMPTEIFRPGMHPYPPAPHVPASSPSATRVAPAPRPAPRREGPSPQGYQGHQGHPPQQAHPAPQAHQLQQQLHQPQQQHHQPQQQHYPPPQQQPQPSHRAPVPGPAQPTAMAPVNFSGLGGDDWDGETVVKQPAALTTSRHREPVRALRAPVQKPFNPDETVVITDDIGVDVDFGDETHNVSPPPRRR